MASNNPYRPGFGKKPPVLAGRTEAVQATIAALRDGPSSMRFCQAFVGERGVGKTALLAEIESRVRSELDWAVLHRQAIPDAGFVEALVQQLPRALGALPRSKRWLTGLEKEVTVSVNLLAVKADATTRTASSTSRAQPSDILEQLFRVVGTQMRKQRTGLLITIDEAHVVPRTPDLAALGAAIQLVTSIEALPVSVIFAGLPELLERFHGIGTYLKRLPVRTLEDLGRDATELALVKPVAGRTAFDDDALELLVDVSGGHPYLIQLLGWTTWEAVGGGRRVRIQHARTGVAAAKEEMGAQFKETWSALTDFQRAYLIACARLGPGPVDSAAVAAFLQRSTKQVSPIRQQLLDRSLISVPRYGQVQIANPLLALWVRDQPSVTVRRR